MPAAWIVPKNNKSTLVTRADPRGDQGGPPPLVEVGPVAMPLLAPHVLDLAEDALVFGEDSTANAEDLLVLGEHNGGIVIVRGLSSGSPSSLRVPIPRMSKIHAVTLIDGVIYVGGMGYREVLGRIDLRGQPRWRPMAVPPEVRAPGKGIDGFALHDGKLIAVDDVIEPRYMLLYDVTDARAPRYIGARDVPTHSSYEAVKSVASNPRSLVLLSTSSNHGLYLVHVTLMDLATLEERAVLNAAQFKNAHSGSLPVADFRGVAIREDTLLIAAGDAGIAVLPISPWLEREAGGERVRGVPFGALRFVPVNGERVVRVAPIDDASAFAVTQDTAGAVGGEFVYSSRVVSLR